MKINSVGNVDLIYFLDHFHERKTAFISEGTAYQSIVGKGSHASNGNNYTNSYVFVLRDGDIYVSNSIELLVDYLKPKIQEH